MAATAGTVTVTLKVEVAPETLAALDPLKEALSALAPAESEDPGPTIPSEIIDGDGDHWYLTEETSAFGDGSERLYSYAERTISPGTLLQTEAQIAARYRGIQDRIY